MRKINVIIVNGAPRSGKDTFIQRVKWYVNAMEIARCDAYSTIDPIRNMLRELGWNGEKTDEVRNMMASMKQFWINMNDGPLRYCIDNIINMARNHKNDDLVIIFQIREPSEIEKLKNALHSIEQAYSLNVSTLFVNRSVAEERHYENKADADVAEYKYDVVISNNGSLDELKEQATKYINELLEVKYDE